MLEFQPSMDAELAMQPNIGPTGADATAQELEQFNAKYQYIVDTIYGRLQEIAAKCPGDIVTLVSSIMLYLHVDMITSWVNIYSLLREEIF